MADKYAHKNAPPSPAERAVNILQCRMSWSEAEACVAALVQAAGLPTTDRATAIAVFHGRMSRSRAVACVNDLATAGLIPRAAFAGG